MSIDITNPGVNQRALKQAFRKLTDPSFNPPLAAAFTLSKYAGGADPTFVDTDDGLLMGYGEARPDALGKCKLVKVAVNSAADWTLTFRLKPRPGRTATGNFGFGVAALNSANGKMAQFGVLNSTFGAWAVRGTLDAYSADISYSAGTYNQRVINGRLIYDHVANTLAYDLAWNGQGDFFEFFAAEATNGASYLAAPPTHVGLLMHCGSLAAGKPQDYMLCDRWELA
jgi:hypothetical protein